MKSKAQYLNELETAAYLDDRISGRKKTAIDRLAEGPGEFHDNLCLIRRLLADCGAPLNKPEIPEQLIEKTVRLYRKRDDVFDIVVSLADEALSVLRSSFFVHIKSPLQVAAIRRERTEGPTMAVLTRTFDAVTMEIGIERLSGKRCNFIVNASAPGNAAPLKNMRAELLSNGREFTSCLLEQGEALFEDLRPGNYEIVVKQGKIVYGKLAIRIDA